MKKLMRLLLIVFVVYCHSVFAVKVQFKATPMSENLIKGPYAVYVFYTIYDDTTDVSNINGIIDMPLLKREDIRNIKIRKSGKLIKGQKPKFSNIQDGPSKPGLISSFGFTDYDITQGDAYAYMLYINYTVGNSKSESELKKVSVIKNIGKFQVDTQVKPLTRNAVDDPPGVDPGDTDPWGGTTTIASIPLGNPDIAYAKLNNVFREASHNTYQNNIVNKSEVGFLKALSYSRVVEIDLHSTFMSNEDGWDVFHVFPLDNNCGSYGGGELSDCLQDIVRFHNAHPEHDPIIVFLDLKTDFTSNENRTPLALDALLISKFGNDIYRPSDFRGSNTDMRLMAQKNNWPSFEDILGKFIFVLGAESERLNTYRSSRGSNTVCFVMAGTFEPYYIEMSKIQDLGTEMDYNYEDDFIFYNFELSNGNQDEWNRAPSSPHPTPFGVSELGYFTRVFSTKPFPFIGPGNYNELDFIAVKRNKTNAIATGNFNESRSYEDDGIYDLDEVDNPVLTDNHIYSTYPITQYGKESINVANLIVEPNTNYRLISGGPITGISNAVFKPGSNVQILEYQSLTSSLKYYLLRSQMLTQEEIDEIMKEINSGLYNFQPIAFEKLEKFDFVVYPSHASSLLNFVYVNDTGSDIIIEIYNLSGQKVVSKIYTGQSTGQHRHTINIEDLNAGLYVIRLVANSTISTSKFIKQ